MSRKPKFKIGQVVNVREFIDPRLPGETGPGFACKAGWRWGRYYARVVRIVMPGKLCKPTAPICYFLTEYPSAMSEKWLRPLTERESER